MNSKQEIIRMLYDHKSHIEELHRRIKKLEDAVSDSIQCTICNDTGAFQEFVTHMPVNCDCQSLGSENIGSAPLPKTPEGVSAPSGTTPTEESQP